MSDLDAIRSDSLCLADRLHRYLKYGCDKLDIVYDDLLDAIYHSIRIDNRLKSRNPRVIAASLIYLICFIRNYDHTQVDIANIFDLGDLAVRNCFHDVVEHYFQYKGDYSNLTTL